MPVDRLAAASRALAGRTPDRLAALEQLVLAWREQQRPPQLAALVEALSAEIVRGLAPSARIDATLEPGEFHTAWVGEAVNAGLAEVELLLPGLFRGPLGKRIRQRFALILPFADDPRVTAAFARMIAEPPVLAATSFPMWRQLFAALAQAPDPRVRPVLEQTLASARTGAQLWPLLQQLSLALLKQLPKQPPTLSAALREQIASLRAQIDALAPVAASEPAPSERGDPIEAALLAKIYAEPDALEHRAVWADALLARGDPRGEFVHLQLTRTDPGASEREAQLLAEYEPSWLGELAPVVDRKRLRWARGFPVAAEVAFETPTQLELRASEAWATFAELDCDDLELITSPTLRSIRRIGGLSIRTLRALVEASGPALRLTRLGPITLEQAPPAELAAIRAAAAERLAELRELWLLSSNLAPAQLDWLLATALGRRLTGLRLAVVAHERQLAAHPPWPAWLAARTRWPGLARLRFDLATVSVEFAGRRLTIRTHPSRARGAARREQDFAALEALRGEFDDFELISCGPTKLRERPARQLGERLGFAEFVHTHARFDDDALLANDAAALLRRVRIRQAKAAGRLARARRAGPAQPPPPRRYGDRDSGPWLVCDAEALARARYDRVNSIAFTPDGDELLVFGAQVYALGVPELRVTWALRDRKRLWLTRALLEPDTRRAWFGCHFGATIVWDLEQRRELARAQFHRSAVIGFAPAGRRTYSLGADRKLHAWSCPEPAPDGEPVMLVPEHSVTIKGAPDALAVDPSQTQLAIANNGVVHRWTIAELEHPRPRPVILGRVGLRASALAYAPTVDRGGSERLAAASIDGELSLWTRAGAQLEHRACERRLADIAWTPDGRVLAVGDDEAGPRIRALDPDTGAISLEIVPPGTPGSVAVSPRRCCFAVCAALGGAPWIGLWGLDGEEIAVWRG